MTLKTQSAQIIEVGDWDTLVEETYKRPYSFQQQEGCRDRGVVAFSVPGDATDFENDSVPEIVNHGTRGVSFRAWLERDPNAPIRGQEEAPWYLRLWWERNFYPDVQMVANDLYARKLLDAGDYAITIDW